MKPIEIQRVAERTALLSRLATLLEQDPAVAAAWLHGSLGRGEEDAWSDLDVWIVVRDEAFDPVLRRRLPAQLSETLFTVEAPQNGPPGGSYLMSAHDAPSGPHLVDWYVQPLAFARPTFSQVILVDRAAWPVEPKNGLPVAVGLKDEVANRAALFWAMLLIQGKAISRNPAHPEMEFEGFILSLLTSVAESRGKTVAEFGSEKLARLRGLSDRMSEIASDLAAPKEPVARFLASVESAL